MAIPRLPGELGSIARIFPTRFGFRARAGNARCAPRVHHEPAIRFLLVADPDHVHFGLKPELVAGERERASPLSRAGLSGDSLYPELPYCNRPEELPYWACDCPRG